MIIMGVVMVRLKCPRCSYEWEYKGRLLRANCPSCGKKVDVKKYRVE
jgi:DNA-directed RNA polymerase subunit RPC12/RpoP